MIRSTPTYDFLFGISRSQTHAPLAEIRKAFLDLLAPAAEQEFENYEQTYLARFEKVSH